MAYGNRVLVPALDQPGACFACPARAAGSIGFSAPEGTGNNGVIALAERLGEHEVSDGLPLRPQAAAGSVWDRSLRQLGMSRSEFKIYNIINCKIPHEELKGQPYEWGAIEHCRVHRDPLMLNFPDSGPGYKQKVILAMGDIAARTLTGLAGPENKIEKLRGYPIETAYGLVLPTYNPAKIYRESKLFGVLKGDIQYAVDIAKNGWAPPAPRYQEWATPADAEAFYQRAKALCDATLWGAELPLITCDIENDFDRSGRWVRLTSVQFSLGKDEGIFLEANASNNPIIHALFALNAQFWFHNGWRHDMPILTQDAYYADGVRWTVLDPIRVKFGGPVHDSLWAFRHAQPDLATQDSGGDEGLGISSKMGLQYVASLYRFPRRWKHLSKSNLRYYGICDVDALQYIVPPLVQQLKDKGQWESYHMHVVRYDPIMVACTDRGIPVNEERRQAVRIELAAELEKVAAEIQELYPNELKNIEPAKGYTRAPKEKEGLIRWEPLKPIMFTSCEGKLGRDLEWYDKDDNVWRAMEYRLFKGLKVKQKVACQCFTLVTHAPDTVTKKGVIKPGKAYAKPKKVYDKACALCAGKKTYTQVLTEEHRWVKVLPFKPSKDQIIRYMEYRHHKVPKKKKKGGVRTATTDFKELEKLANTTGDPLYKKIVGYRKFEKLISTYIDGWKPQEDGCVHPVFLASTATHQLASESPNALNPPKHNEVLANKFRSMIIAPPGYTWLELDFKSFHGATLAAESGDEVYYKIAVKVGDAHSFLASYLVNEPIDPTLSIEELKERCAYIKKKHKLVRNTSAKQANLGYGFGMQGPGLYERYAEYFEARPCKTPGHRQPCGHACQVIDMLDHLYEKNKKWRDSQIVEAFENGGRNGSGWLLSKYGHIRWFNSIYTYRNLRCENCNGEGCWNCRQKGRVWERKNGSDIEDIYAFKPANHAHCAFKEVQIRLDNRGLLEKYGLRLPYHDAIWALCPDPLVEEGAHVMYQEMTQPLVRLAHPTLCPQGLVVDVDCNVGKSWDAMSGYKIAA